MPSELWMAVKMFHLKFFVVLVFSTSLRCEYVKASNTNFQVKSFKLCNNTQGLIKFHGNITKEGSKYYATANLITPIPLDENIGVNCKIETKVLNNYVELFTIGEKNFCKAATMYGGEFWYALQRAAQVIPKTCPLPARRYEVHHAEVDFNKVALQTFPFGDLRFTGKAVDNKHPNNNLICLQLEVENIPN